MKKIFIILFLFISFNAYAEEPFWQYLNGPNFGNVNKIIQDSNQSLYINTDNGIFKSNDYAQSWLNLYSYNTYINFLICNDNSKLFRISNAYTLVEFSSDYGKNWQNIHYPDKFYLKSYPIFGMDKNDNLNLMSIISDTIFVSIFNYQTNSWNINFSILNKTKLNKTNLIDKFNKIIEGNILIIGGSIDLGNYNYYGLFFYSTDYGKSWNESSKLGSFIFNVDLLPNNKILACSDSGVFLSNDLGKTWSSTNIIDKVDNSIVLNSSEWILHTSNYGIIYTSDAGQTWEERNNGIIDPNFTSGLQMNNRIYISNSYGIFYSDDKGINWYLSNNGFTAADISHIAFDKQNNIYVIGNGLGLGVHISTNNGISWNCIGFQNTRLGALLVNGKGYIYIGGLFIPGVYRSTDLGKTWENHSEGLYYGTDTLLVENFYEDKKGYLFDLKGERSTDDGLTWVTLNYDGLCHILAENSEGHLFRGDYSSIVYQSTDDGDTWVKQGAMTNDVVYCGIDNFYIIFDPRDSTGWSSCMKTIDNGRSWQLFDHFTFNFDEIPTVFDSLGNYIKKTYGVDTVGVKTIFQSIDKGKTWNDISSGLQHLGINTMAVSPNGYIYAAAYNGGLYRSRDRFVSVPDEPVQSVIDELIITPNPADNEIKIQCLKYLLGKNYLKIYNLLGEELIRKDNFNYNNLNIDISNLSNGLYILQMNSEFRKFIVKR